MIHRTGTRICCVSIIVVTEQIDFQHPKYDFTRRRLLNHLL
jgi:hypothetical protein